MPKSYATNYESSQRRKMSPKFRYKYIYKVWINCHIDLGWILIVKKPTNINLVDFDSMYGNKTNNIFQSSSLSVKSVQILFRLNKNLAISKQLNILQSSWTSSCLVLQIFFCINYLKFRTNSDDHEGHLTKIFQVISIKNTNNLCA